MAASDNQFFIQPANALQVLMAGQQGYETGQKNLQQNQMQQGRQEAMLALQNGGDLKSPLAKLIGIGDDTRKTTRGQLNAFDPAVRTAITIGAYDHVARSRDELERAVVFGGKDGRDRPTDHDVCLDVAHGTPLGRRQAQSA